LAIGKEMQLIKKVIGGFATLREGAFDEISIGASKTDSKNF
jgi:hypothetical protein